MSAEAKDQIRHEGKCFLNRWDKECDLTALQIAKCVFESINEWLEEDIIEFDPDPDPEEDE